MKFRTVARPFETGEFVSDLTESGVRRTVSRQVGELAVRSCGHALPAYGLEAKVAYETPEGWVYNAGQGDYWVLAKCDPK